VDTPTAQERLDNQYFNMRQVAVNCRLLRKEYGLTQEQLSEIADIQRYQITHIEGNKYYNVRFATLCLVARAFDLTISEFCHPDLREHLGIVNV